MGSKLHEELSGSAGSSASAQSGYDERNKILKKRDGINAAGRFFNRVLRPMLVKILLVV